METIPRDIANQMTETSPTMLRDPEYCNAVILEKWICETTYVASHSLLQLQVADSTFPCSTITSVLGAQTVRIVPQIRPAETHRHHPCVPLRGYVTSPLMVKPFMLLACNRTMGIVPPLLLQTLPCFTSIGPSSSVVMLRLLLSLLLKFTIILRMSPSIRRFAKPMIPSNC